MFGLIFGGTNVGVQIIAYLKTFDLNHSTFVGVVAMVFMGIGSIRVVTAWGLGLYDSPGVIAISVVAALPGVVGAWSGKRLRPLISRGQRDFAVSVLLTVIGTRLLWRGLVGVA